MSEERTEYHVHRTLPDDPTIQVKVGLSAAGKPTYEVNTHAPTVAQAIAMLDEATGALKERGYVPATLSEQLEASIRAAGGEVPA